MEAAEDMAEAETVEFYIVKSREGMRKAIERAVMLDPGLSLQVKLLVVKIISKVR